MNLLFSFGYPFEGWLSRTRAKGRQNIRLISKQYIFHFFVWLDGNDFMRWASLAGSSAGDSTQTGSEPASTGQRNHTGTEGRPGEEQQEQQGIGVCVCVCVRACVRACVCVCMFS